jgi:hypothetical protein
MRILFILILSISIFSLKAQTRLPLTVTNYSQNPGFNNYHLSGDSNTLNKKWSFNKYMAVSTSFGFYNGGSTSAFSVPIGLQVNRRLTNNLYAFAGLSIAPTYFTSNRSFNDPGSYKINPGFTQFSSKGFGMNSRVEGGLMYVNDERTFSISGSIAVERNTYPLYPVNRTITTPPQQPVNVSRHKN